MKKQSDLKSSVKHLFGVPTPGQGENVMRQQLATDLTSGMSHKPIRYNPGTAPVLQQIQTSNDIPKQAPKPEPKINWGSREAVSAILDPIRKFTGSPLGMAGVLGLTGAGVGYGLWRNAVETGGSLGRYPIRKLTGMTDDEYDAAMEELAADKRYKWLIPGALAALLGGGYLALRSPGPYTKWASQDKQADELFSYGGYVPDINFHQIVNAGQAKELFTNDPNLKNDPYVKNMGMAIINDAANRAGYVNPTLGNIYDSTVNKVKSKLSWQGVTGIAANTMLANATAHLFTSALGAVVPLPKDVKRKIIDAGTWAAAITSIFT